MISHEDRRLYSGTMGSDVYWSSYSELILIVGPPIQYVLPVYPNILTVHGL